MGGGGSQLGKRYKSHNGKKQRRPEPEPEAKPKHDKPTAPQVVRATKPVPEFTEEQRAQLLGNRPDFLGINFYSATCARAWLWFSARAWLWCMSFSCKRRLHALRGTTAARLQKAC